MAIKVNFFEGPTYFSADFVKEYKDYIKNGVVAPEANALKVTPVSGKLTVSVDAGGCFINGYFIYNDAPVELTITPFSGGTSRLDAIVVNLDITNKTATIGVLANYTSSMLTSNMLLLATVTVPAGATSLSTSNITDQRKDIALNFGTIYKSSIYFGADVNYNILIKATASNKLEFKTSDNINYINFVIAGLTCNGNISATGSITSTGSAINVGGNGDTGFDIYKLTGDSAKIGGTIGLFPGWDANKLYLNIYSNAGIKTIRRSNGIEIGGKITLFSPGSTAIDLSNGGSIIMADGATVDGVDISEHHGKAGTVNNPVHPLVTTNLHGFMSKDDKTKLDTIQPNAEPNQNAYSFIILNNDTSPKLSADSKTANLRITAKNGVKVSANNTDGIVFEFDNSTVNVDANTLNGKNSSDFALANHTHQEATQSIAGFLSATDKTFIDTLSSFFKIIYGKSLSGSKVTDVSADGGQALQISGDTYIKISNLAFGFFSVGLRIKLISGTTGNLTAYFYQDNNNTAGTQITTQLFNLTNFSVNRYEMKFIHLPFYGAGHNVWLRLMPPSGATFYLDYIIVQPTHTAMMLE